LGVHFVDSDEGGIIIQNNSKFSHASNVKKDLDPTLVKSKKAVFEKSIEAFFQEGDGVFRY